jgi:hypothetical protein
MAFPVAAGRSPKLVQERLAYSRINLTLETYSHILPGIGEGEADKVNLLMEG